MMLKSKKEEEDDAEEMLMIRCWFRRYAVERSANNRCAFSVDLIERPMMARGRVGEVKGKKDSVRDDADVRMFRTLHVGTDDDIVRNG